MKDGFFQLRLSQDDRAKLDALARHYGLSASAVICMMITEKGRELGINLGGLENEKKL